MDDENQSECQSQQRSDKPPFIWKMDSQLSDYDYNRELEELSGERQAYEKQYYNSLLPVKDKLSQSVYAFQWDAYYDNSIWPPFQTPIPYAPEEPRSIPYAPEEQIPTNLSKLQTSPLIAPIIPKKVRQKNQQKFPNKSFCRYILLYAFRTIEKQQYSDTIQEICNRNNVNFELFKAYYTKQRLVIQGYQVLKRELITTNDVKEVEQRKIAFQEYLIWYLDRIATKDILSSKKIDLKEYIKFKNEVMCYYIRFPKQWNGNKAEWI